MVRMASSGSRQARVKNQEGGKRQELTGQTLISLTNKTNWQQTNREHRYKYPGDNGEDGRNRKGVETSTRTGETDQGMTEIALYLVKHNFFHQLAKSWQQADSSAVRTSKGRFTTLG